MSYYDENWALKKAAEIACKSPCRSKRGVVIWHRNYGYISGGYNEPLAPFICDGSDKCKNNCPKTAIHAEQRALMEIVKLPNLFKTSECEMLHVKVVDGKAVFSEKPSCWQCSKLILASGLKSMWLYQKEGLTEYSPLDFHQKTFENCDLI